ncbi:hypothetical protein [Dactylosporangium darangshiense]
MTARSVSELGSLLARTETSSGAASKMTGASATSVPRCQTRTCRG